MCVSKAVEESLARSRKVVGVEGSDAVAFKADDNAVQALFFSFNCSVQCWRSMWFKLGAR
jgi:hypothetical protein